METSEAMKKSERALFQCAYAIGAGAKMKIQVDALAALQGRVKKGFERLLDEGSTKWEDHDTFILDRCEAVGRLAATMAIGGGSSSIKETEHLKPAYIQVRKTAREEIQKSNPSALEGLGGFCPEWR